MKQLTLASTDDGALILEDDNGARYRLTLDEDVRGAVRRAPLPEHTGRKVSPRDIQAHIREGMSAHDVAELTGASLEYIERFEGPVLAEREHIVGAALAVPVRVAADADPDEEPRTFGDVIGERLRDREADDDRWTSWKDPAEGWIVKLTFDAGDVEHDARWTFDPRTSALVPVNNDAVTLSQQGELPGALAPRLRAVGEEPAHDSTRFDSGAFHDRDLGLADTLPHAGPSVMDFSHSSIESVEAEVDRAPSHQTADLLEALRRRRGERESAGFDDEPHSDHPSTGSIRVVDVPLDDPAPLADPSPSPEPAMSSRTRKGRPSMPSRDEIVFGAKPDDPA